jgi:hypothetical protein
MNENKNESYGKMIFLNEEAKDKVRGMSEEDLDMFSAFLSHSIRKTEMKIEKEFYERHQQQNDL